MPITTGGRGGGVYRARSQYLREDTRSTNKKTKENSGGNEPCSFFLRRTTCTAHRQRRVSAAGGQTQNQRRQCFARHLCGHRLKACTLFFIHFKEGKKKRDKLPDPARHEQHQTYPTLAHNTKKKKGSPFRSQTPTVIHNSTGVNKHKQRCFWLAPRTSGRKTRQLPRRQHYPRNKRRTNALIL